jgi:hypothetical protein
MSPTLDFMILVAKNRAIWFRKIFAQFMIFFLNISCHVCKIQHRNAIVAYGDEQQIKN